MKKLKIILADDHNLFREGLKSLLQSEKDVTVIGEVDNGRDAITMCEALKPDVAIVDVAMPELNGMETTRQIRKLNADIQVIALSMHSSRRYVLDMLKAGATAYLVKDCAFQELTAALKAVRENNVYLSPSIAGKVVAQATFPSSQTSFEDSALTSREKEVLQLLTEGNKVREVATRLHISIKTVQTHRRNIMEKLNLYNLADLTKYALRSGLISHE